jgi:putative DNA primase/helicase
MTAHYQAIDSFKEAMISAIGYAPAQIDTSGKLNRFSTNGKSLDKAGYYGFFLDPIPAGYYGDFRTGVKQNWIATYQERVSPQILAEARRKVAAIREQSRLERDAIAKRAQAKAYADWSSAIPASHAHPYLLKKQIQAHGVRLLGDKLIIPLVDFDGVLHSYQTIAPTGEKRFLAGGRKKGLFYVMGSDRLENEIAILCEGFATGASIFDMHQCKRPVLIAFDAGNLQAVAEAYRARYPYTRLHIYADDDRAKPINTGLNAALAVAHAVSNAQVFTPPFPPDAPPELSDFNDLAVFRSGKSVARAAA